MAKKPEIMVAGDYASLCTERAEFYYGYERTWCPVHGGNHEAHCPDHCNQKEWCFTAEFEGQHIQVPTSKLLVEDKFNCVECLLMGIGWVLTKYPIDCRGKEPQHAPRNDRKPD